MAFQVSQFPQGGGLRVGDAVQQGLQIKGQIAGQEAHKQDRARVQQEQQMPLLIEGAKRLSLIPAVDGKLQLLQTMRNNFGRAGMSTDVLDQGIQQLQGGDLEGFNSVTDRLIEMGKQQSRKGSASPRAFAPDTVRKFVGKDENGNDVFGLFSRQIVFDPNTQESRAVEVPIDGDLVTSTGETITQKRAEEVQFAGDVEEAKAAGSAEGESKSADLIANTKAKISTAVKLAEKEATARGETLTEVKKMKASLPGLLDVVEQLKDLSTVATSTFGGRMFDTVVRETGFGATEGGTARAKFISIINNQVLPLLKPTFGAQFTVQEGEALKATMGDPNLSPTERVEVLNSFIDQKSRDIQGAERELGQPVTPTEDLLNQDFDLEYNPSTGAFE